MQRVHASLCRFSRFGNTWLWLLTRPVQIICDQRRTLNNTLDADFCNSNEVSSAVSDWNFYYSGAAALPALLTVTLLGALSDCYGRKIPMLVSLAGYTVQCIFNLLLALVPYDYRLLYAGQVLYGLSGTYASMLMALFAACADESRLEARTSRIGTMEAALLAGLSVGGILGGTVQQRVGLVAVFGGCVVLAVGLGVAMATMQETLPVARRGKLSLKQANFFAVMGILVRGWKMGLLSCVFVLSVGVVIGAGSVFLLYVRHVFNMTLELYGYLNAAIQLFRAVGLLLVLPAVLRYFGNRPRAQLLCGAAASLVAVAQLVTWATVPSEWALFAGTALGVATSWPVIVARGLMSRLAGPARQGVLMGAVAVLEACLIPFAGAAIFNSTYSATVGPQPAAFLYVGAGAYVVAGLVLLVLVRMRGDEANEVDDSSEGEHSALIKPVNSPDS